MASVASVPRPAAANRILKPVPATAESLAGYGYLIGEPAGQARDRMDFYGEAVKVTQPAKFNGNADLCLNLVSFQPRPLRVNWMEFHSKHTQTFIPLLGKPFYMVLGKPTCRRPDGTWDTARPELPDPETVRAFAFDGSGGIVMEKGTWHEVPFPQDGLTHFVCICTNETNDNLESQLGDGECQGGDLTKRNLIKRFGYTFDIDP
jgi:ureidoglycolate lyase